jgi:hypothetical protein
MCVTPQIIIQKPETIKPLTNQDKHNDHDLGVTGEFKQIDSSEIFPHPGEAD